MLNRKTLPLLAGSALLAACASSGDSRLPIADEVQYAQGEPVSQLCFTRSIDGFSDTTDDSVVVFRSPRDRYLLRTYGYCQDLDHAQSLSLLSFSGCLTPGDSIQVRRYFPGLPETALTPSRCRIRSIHEWVAQGAAEDGP